MPTRKITAPLLELDLGRYELRRAGHRIKIEKKPMELLIFLVSRREQLVTREDIAARLWPSDLFVDIETNINNIVRKIRSALSDNSEKPAFLETVVGKGYRFIGPLRVVDAKFPSLERLASTTAAIPAPSLHAIRSESSSLAALPLVPLGNTSDEQGLSLGFADALISRLGNLPGVDVLPTSSVLNIPAGSESPEVASRLGVRFVVRGSIQTNNFRSHVSLEMYDANLRRLSFSRVYSVEAAKLLDLKNEIAANLAHALNRSLPDHPPASLPRYSRDPMAYNEFMQGYRRSSSGERHLLEESAQHLSNAITRDPSFALAHAVLSYVCAVLHFEFDPSWVWLERAEFHCRRALELNADLPEGHVANAFLLWGPSKNFQHVEAIGELKRALALQSNLPHAYNRLGTILAHIGLLDSARAMYERGRSFDPRKSVSHSIIQVYIWSGEFGLAQEEIERWRSENPTNKYAIYFAPQPALFTGKWKQAKGLLDEATRLLSEDPMIASLNGVFHALTGNTQQALRLMSRACASPKTFGHAHHTYYQVACILSLLGRLDSAFEWFQRGVDTGFACWPFFLKDPCLRNLRSIPQFETLVSSLQAKYPSHLGTLPVGPS
ncbi:MAG TPA: winged helix-turn-helix domain-containing protein [Candidatus Acidoferrum sp.]|nr:winged helix-turn-helix domain-containing protein [Candidatus Acidoferrum sp.]